MGIWQATHRTYSAGREALAERFIFGVLYDVKEQRLLRRTFPSVYLSVYLSVCLSVRPSVTVSATISCLCQNFHKIRNTYYLQTFRVSLSFVKIAEVSLTALRLSVHLTVHTVCVFAADCGDILCTGSSNIAVWPFTVSCSSVH